MRGMEEYFRRRSFPRLTLGMILLVTGASGFGISLLILKLGLAAMWLRYPLAALGAYGIFLVLMRIWVEVERHSFDPNDPEVLELLQQESLPKYPFERREKKHSWLDWLDLPTDIPGDEGCLPVILIGALLVVATAIIAGLILAVSSAPALIAEVFVDAVLVGALYRRLKIAARENWLGTCIRKTWVFVAVTVFLLFAGGLWLSLSAPGAKTIGPALRQIFPPKHAAPS